MCYFFTCFVHLFHGSFNTSFCSTPAYNQSIGINTTGNFCLGIRLASLITFSYLLLTIFSWFKGSVETAPKYRSFLILRFCVVISVPGIAHPQPMFQGSAIRFKIRIIRLNNRRIDSRKISYFRNSEQLTSLSDFSIG